MAIAACLVFLIARNTSVGRAGVGEYWADMKALSGVASAATRVHDDVIFSHTNSDRWLYGNRVDNLEDPMLTSRMVQDLILHVSPLSRMADSPPPSADAMAPLRRSMCVEGSRFLDWRPLPNAGSKEEREMALHYLSFRLAFLAMHEHQHRHARREAEERQRHGFGGSGRQEMIRITSGNSTGLRKAPGRFDYECPDAQFLVNAVPEGFGLGYTVRNGVLETVEVAMATDRVALFINAASTGPNRLQHGLSMASCPRRDMQCFFMPLSPCTITEQELEDAPELSREESRQLGRSAELSEKYKDTRVIIMGRHIRATPTWNWAGRVGQIMHVIHSLVNRDFAGLSSEVKRAYGLDEQSLEEVRDYLMRQERNNRWLLNHVAIFYILRPNPTSQGKIDELMDKIFPPDFDAETAIGLPVRSSDKCMGESECLSFNQYVRLTKDLATRRQSTNSTNGDKRYRSIVLTSETLSILQARHEYEEKEDFPFRFIANDEDVAQGTGDPSKYQEMGAINVTADDVMLSTMTSLKMQLMTESTVGNCCSNFHKVMLEFLQNGCGAAKRNHFECLQDNENPEFRVCCEWSTSPECKQKQATNSFGTNFSIGSDILHPDLVKAGGK